MKSAVRWQTRFLLMLLFLIILIPSETENAFSFDEGGIVVKKTFSQMTEDEKEKALEYLITQGEVPKTIKVSGKTYSLNLTLWRSKGLITYGETSVVNSIVQVTNSPNYKEGQWRYWGFDMNCGLYGNDDFPPDRPSNTPPQNKNWLTTVQIRNTPTAANYIGRFAMDVTDKFSNSDKLATAEAFLSKNPGWVSSGKDADYIVNHFYFNCVLTDSGLTRGQFIGVHKGVDGNYYYQTFEVKGGTVKFIVPPEIESTPDEPEDPDPEQEEPVAPPPLPGSDINVNCVLGLPPITYTGHPALASDQSVFLVGDQGCSAERAYSERLASNSFQIIDGGGIVQRISNTKAEVRFNQKGNYQVKLSVTPDGGERAFDVKPIEVKPTPAIMHGLGGTQKQNRKQVINIKIAKHPESTLTDFWVKIDYIDKDESVTLHNRMGAGENTLSNSTNIKTRPIVRLAGSDEYYECCRLEFLLKNTEPANCKYTIYVKDSRGNMDQASADFSVSKDKPPEADVFLEGAYLRKPNSDTAGIVAEDISITDGDQVSRSWFFRAVEKESADGGDALPWLPIGASTAGYEDYSFGSGKKIGFNKQGVGKFEVKLVAKDVWVEETLPEYVNDSERLESTATATSEVINMAPVVSLEPLAVKTADITILAGGQEEYDKVKENLATIENDLLQQGIGADITVEKMAPAASEPGNQPAVNTLEARTPFGYEGQWTFYEEDNFIIDDESFYKIDASWPNDSSGGYPEPPHTISCWNWDAINTHDKKWTYTFNSNTFNVPVVSSGPYFAQDDSGKYLFFVADGKTLILTKDNGSFLTILDIEVGRNCYVEGNWIYTFKEDGIYSISAATGQVKKIYNGPIPEGQFRRLKGKVNFVTGKQSNMLRGLFDPLTGKVNLEPIQFASFPPGIINHKVLGTDVDGKLIIHTIVQKQGRNGEIDRYYYSRTFVYGGDNSLVYAGPEYTDEYLSPQYNPVAVYDEGGRCNYIAYTNDGKDKVTAYLYAIDGGYTKYIAISGKNDDPCMAERIAFAREIDGQVYLCCGAYWGYVWQVGYNAYLQRTKVFVFDPQNDTVKGGDYYNDIGIDLSTIEYGLSSDALAAVQTSYGTPGNAYSLNLILKWAQSLEQILNRHISKSFRGGKDINALVVYDETNKEYYTETIRDLLESKADSLNGKLVMANRSDIEGSGLSEAIVSAGSDGKKLLGISVAEGIQGGTISREFRLTPGKTYYYEYDAKQADGSKDDILDIQYVYTRPDGSQFEQETYVTTESYYEDFDNPDKTEPFFTLTPGLIDSGYYKGATVYRKASKNAYSDDPYPEESTKIKFTIPEGKSGFLSFDYMVRNDNFGHGTDNWPQCNVKIDGILWKASEVNDPQGHYSHPDLLQPGEHELTFFACEYGREIWAKMWLDSLRVDILEESGKDLPGSDCVTLMTESLPGGFVHIKGSFETPPLIASYGRVQNAAIIDGDIGSVPYTRITNTNADKFAFDFQVPAGKTAILTHIPTQSKPGRSGDRYYNVVYKVKLYYINKEDGWAYSTWTSMESNKNDEDARFNIPWDYILNPGELEETKPFSLAASAKNGSSGKFLGITSVIVDSCNKGWRNLDHFLVKDGNEMKYFLQKDMLEGAKITFRFPEGNHLIKDLKLYYIEDSVKVYAEAEPFTDSSMLSKWMTYNATTSIMGEMTPQPDEKGLIYKKNELVAYNINYYDYEGDPSRREYWKYTHLPYNDGPHPDAAVIINDDNEPVEISGKVLDAPIKRFNIDGKYIVEHWQEDNTARPPIPSGNPDYDKLSNVESIVFYVQGGGSAPWIKSIKTSPPVIKEGDAFKIQIDVDDNEKDILQLITEVYLDKKIVYKHKQDDIVADLTGIYPTVNTGNIPFPAAAGRYEVVCTVRDYSGAGIDSYRFTVVSEGKITGRINHTDEWDKNRKKFNIAYFGEEFNQRSSYEEYIVSKIPRKRGINVFWSGERFMLVADVAGDPIKVTSEIVGYPTYKATLTNTGNKNAQGEAIYKGQLWNNNMIDKWGKIKPQQLTFRFTAEYEGGSEKTFEDSIIVDSSIEYWLLHRVW